MAAKRGAATISYCEDSVQVKLEHHGTFTATTAGFKATADRTKAGLVRTVSHIYDGHGEGYQTQAYWRQYPTDVLRVIVADCYCLGVENVPARSTSVTA